MTQSHKPGRIESFLLLGLITAILLCLVAPPTAGCLPLSFLCITLVPLFLFAALETQAASPLPEQVFATPAAAQNARPALFQIPPPLPSAQSIRAA